MNPYALGFAMMADIQRICEEPTAEDREWFPDFAGNNDWSGTLKNVWANYRDEIFVRQFLSPQLMRKLKLFVLTDKAANPRYRVDAIHDADGYRRVRSALADSYDVTAGQPDIQVADVDLLGNRELVLRHDVRNGVALSKTGLEPMMRHIRNLWGYDVRLENGPGSA